MFMCSIKYARKLGGMMFNEGQEICCEGDIFVSLLAFPMQHEGEHNAQPWLPGQTKKQNMKNEHKSTKSLAWNPLEAKYED
jgi:hypothetical protein